MGNRVCTRTGYFNNTQLVPSYSIQYPYCTTNNNWVLFIQWKENQLTALKEFNNFTSIQLRMKAGTINQTVGKTIHFFMSSSYTANGTTITESSTNNEKNAAYPKTESAAAAAAANSNSPLINLGTFTSEVNNQFHIWTFNATACTAIQNKLNSSTNNFILWCYATNDNYSDYTFCADNSDKPPLLITQGSYVDPSFTITPSTSSIVVGNTIQLATSPTQSGVTWSSSNTTVATVTSSGEVSALTAGTTTITATTSSTYATATVTVTNSSASSGTVTTTPVPEHSFFLKPTQTTLNLTIDNPSNLTFSFSSWPTYLYEAKNTATSLSVIVGSSGAFGSTASVERISATTTPPLSLTINSKTGNNAYGRIENNTTYSGDTTKNTFFYYHIGTLALYYNGVSQNSTSGNNVVTIDAGDTLHFTSTLTYTSCADDVSQWRNGIDSFVWSSGGSITYSNFTTAHYGTGGNNNSCYTTGAIDLTFPKAGTYYVKPFWGITNDSNNRIFSDAICYIIVLPKTPTVYYRITENGTTTWKPCKIYYRINNTWVQCEPYYRINNNWQELIKT